MSEDIERLQQEIDELRQLSLAQAFAYRVLARTLAEKPQLDIQHLQAMLRYAAEELERNPEVSEQVPFHLSNLADDLLYDCYLLRGMDSQTARSRVDQTRKDESRRRAAEPHQES